LTVYSFIFIFKGIIGKQFRDLKFGDRFFYETGDKDLRFTRDQLESIREVTMARLLCNHIDVDFVQQLAFFIAKKDSNPLVDCKSLPKLDLSLWTDEVTLSSNCATTISSTSSSTTTSTTTTSTTTTVTFPSICLPIIGATYSDIALVLGAIWLDTNYNFSYDYDEAYSLISTSLSLIKINVNK
jgi:hypothetical protein